MRGDDRQAHAAGHGFEDGLVAAELEPRVERALLLAAEFLDGQAGARTAFARDEPEAGEVFGTEIGATRERMGPRSDDHQRIGHERGAGQREIRRRTRHDVEVVQVLTQPVDDAVAVQELHRGLHPGTRLAERAQDTRGEILRGVDHRDLEQAALAPAQGLDALLEGLPLGLDALRRLGELPAGFGQEDLTSDDLVQRHPDGFG